MDNRTKTIGAVLLILLLAVAAVGYAINYYAEHRGGEVDPDYFVIKDLDTTSLKFDTDVNKVGPIYGKPVATTVLADAQDIVYSTDDSMITSPYYLSLVSYTLYLDDGTVINGNVTNTGNYTDVDTSKSTVVTSTDMKLYLRSEKADAFDKIRFQLDGSIVSDSGLPVSTGGPAPATAAAVEKIDVKVQVIEYTDATMPVVAIDVMTPELTTAEIMPGETVELSYSITVNGTVQYGYAPTWSVTAGQGIISVSDDGVVTGLSAADAVCGVTGTFWNKTNTANVTVSYIMIKNTDAAESKIVNGNQIRVAINGNTSGTATPSDTNRTIYADIAINGKTYANVDWVIDNTTDFAISAGTVTIGLVTYSAIDIKVNPTQVDGTVGTLTASVIDDQGRTYTAKLFIFAVDASLNVVESNFNVASDAADNLGVHVVEVNKALYGQEIFWTAAAGKVSFSDDGKVFYPAVADPTTVGVFKSTSKIIYIKAGTANDENVAINAQYTVNNAVCQDNVTATVYNPSLTLTYTKDATADTPFPVGATTGDPLFYMPADDHEVITASFDQKVGAVSVKWTTNNASAINVESVTATVAKITAIKDGNAKLRASIVVDNAVFTVETLGNVFTPVVSILDSTTADLNTWHALQTDKVEEVTISVKMNASPSPVALPTDFADPDNTKALQTRTSVLRSSSDVVAVTDASSYDLTASKTLDGRAIVTASWQTVEGDYKPYIDQLFVTVEKPVVNISANDFLLGGGQSRNISATSNAVGGTITYAWSTVPDSDAAVTVDTTVTTLANTVTAVKLGSAVVQITLTYTGTGTGAESVPSVSQVNVTVPIVITGASATVAAGSELPLEADAGIYDILSWASSDKTKATVNAAGVVTGVAAGQVNIMATANVGGVRCTAVYPITVTDAGIIALTLDKGTEGTTDGSGTVTLNATSATITTAPTRTGYHVSGYYTSATGGDCVILPNGSLNNVQGYVADGKWIRNSATTLYAQWDVNSVHFQFEKNNSNAEGITNSQTIDYTDTGDDQKLTQNGFTLEGKSFQGWSTTSTGNKEFDDQATMTDFLKTHNGEQLLYAIWA